MNMTPMIDIVFLLLIFFMTVSQVSEINKEQLELPKLKGSADQKPAVVTVNVNQQGDLIVSAQQVTLGKLLDIVSNELRRVGDDPQRMTIVIRADERSEAGPVNRVIKALEQLQITKVRMAVQTEG
jgi:biopolymer transport protein ExbD